MTTLRTAAQQALEALETVFMPFHPAVIALRAALAEPEPYDQTALELCNVCGWKTLIPGDCCLNCERKHPLGQASTDVPLTVYSVKKAEPVQEPVAWMTVRLNVPIQTTARKDVADEWLKWGEVQPLYAAPPHPKPLTEEEIGIICASLGFAQISPVEVARAIERAHGIGGKDD